MGEKKFNIWQLVITVLLSVGSGFMGATILIDQGVESAIMPVKDQVEKNTDRIKTLEDRVLAHQYTVVEMLKGISDDVKELKSKNELYDANIRDFYKNPPWRSEIRDAIQQHHK